MLQVLIHRFNITGYSLIVSFLENPGKKQTQKKETKSFRQNCPFEIYLPASEDGNAVEVLRINLEHNREISKDLVRPYSGRG